MTIPLTFDCFSQECCPGLYGTRSHDIVHRCLWTISRSIPIDGGPYISLHVIEFCTECTFHVIHAHWYVGRKYQVLLLHQFQDINNAANLYLGGRSPDKSQNYMDKKETTIFGVYCPSPCSRLSRMWQSAIDNRTCHDGHGLCLLIILYRRSHTIPISRHK